MLTTEPLAYHDENTSLTGVLAHDPDTDPQSLCVLLVHGGAGLDDHAREQATRYARLGYPVLACDMFGEGILGDRKRIMDTLTGLRDDPDRMIARATAGLTALREHTSVIGPVIAIGYCFGGLVALTLARAGLDLAGAVSIHGSLATVRPATPGGVRAAVLALHGAADPHVPPGDVAAFQAEMTAVGADWQLHAYGGAEHGFTHAHAITGAIPGVSFNARADARAYATTSQFLSELSATASSHWPGPRSAGR